MPPNKKIGIVQKRQLVEMVARKLRGRINGLHVASVVNILIEEIVVDLKDGLEVRVDGLGVFKVVDIAVRKIRSVNTGMIKFAKRTKSLRLKLSEEFAKWLIKRAKS